MSVFQNIYTQNYEAAGEYQRLKKYCTDFDFFDTCMTNVISTFSWRKLPNPKLPSFMPEQFLTYAGRIARYIDDNGNQQIHAAFPNGNINDIGEFTRYLMVAPDGSTCTRDAEDVEICFNNCFKMPDVYKVKGFADKMSYALRAVDSSLVKAALPIGVLFEDEAQMKMFDKFANPEVTMQAFVAMLKKGMVEKKLEILNLYDSSKIDVLAFWDCFVRTKNLFFTTYGTANVDIQKRERLTEAEGSGNEEITRYSLLDDRYRCRKDFVKRCKEHFGDEIELELNRDITTVFQLEADNAAKMELAKLDFTKGTNPANPEGDVNKEDPKEPKEPKVGGKE